MNAFARIRASGGLSQRSGTYVPWAEFDLQNHLIQPMANHLIEPQRHGGTLRLSLEVWGLQVQVLYMSCQGDKHWLQLLFIYCYGKKWQWQPGPTVHSPAHDWPKEGHSSQEPEKAAYPLCKSLQVHSSHNYTGLPQLTLMLLLYSTKPKDRFFHKSWPLKLHFRVLWSKEHFPHQWPWARSSGTEQILKALDTSRDLHNKNSSYKECLPPPKCSGCCTTSSKQIKIW